MKKTVHPKKTILLNLCTCLSAVGLLLTLPCSAFAARGQPSRMQSPLPAFTWNDTIHSILVNKSQISKKNKIRLYPDAKRQVLFFSASGEDHKVFQLYLFDMDGRLVTQASIRNKETTVLTNILEGNYLFEVFTDDERIENGQVNVR